MNWLKVLDFLFKYGPLIYKTVKEIMDLIGWLRENTTAAALPDTAAVLAFNNPRAVRGGLHLIARECRDIKCHDGLLKYRDALADAKRARLAERCKLA